MEALVVSPCPLCNDPHTYELEVERAPVVQYVNPDEFGSRERTFVRFFTCARNNNRFQAVVHLTEERNEKIRDVRVVGPKHPGM